MQTLGILPEKETRVLKERRIRRLSERFLAGNRIRINAFASADEDVSAPGVIMETPFPIPCPVRANGTMSRGFTTPHPSFRSDKPKKAARKTGRLFEMNSRRPMCS